MASRFDRLERWRDSDHCASTQNYNWAATRKSFCAPPRFCVFGQEAARVVNLEIISDNVSLLNVCLDFSTLTPVGTRTDFEIQRKQEIYSAGIFVNESNGRILAIDCNDGSLDPETAYSEQSVQLRLEVAIDHDSLNNPTDNLGYQFNIVGPEDSATGEPYPLEFDISPQAVRNIKNTLRICNISPSGD